MSNQKKKGFVAEFQAFLMRGNVIDMAVGVIIGGAFQKIVSSLVDDIIMPLISKITGGIDFSNWFISLDGSHYDTLAKAKEPVPPPSITEPSSPPSSTSSSWLLSSSCS